MVSKRKKFAGSVVAASAATAAYSKNVANEDVFSLLHLNS